uniref:WW domain containing adaptor with coiled-coil n=1 Tax=Homo sapiens TaxID=9606 RepID=C9JD58_HUMAN
MVMYARKQQRLSDGCHDRRGDSQPYQVPAEAGVEGLEGAGGGREGLLLERRPQKSIQALRCNTSETSTADPLKIPGT